MSKKKVPELRFKGFSDDWEQRKLGEVADIIGGGTPSTNNEEYWDGDIDWYSPVEIGEQIYVDESQKKITRLGLQKSSAKILPVGTVLFTSRAGIGNTAILAKEGATNQGFQSIVPSQGKLDSYFIYSCTHKLKRFGEINGAGSTFVEVSGKQMAKMLLLIPNMDEQKKIGNFFRQLDHTYALLQKKLDQYQTLKKAFLQLMFPQNGESVPKIRFANFESRWEQRKLDQLVDRVKSYSLSRDVETNDYTGYKYVHYGDIHTKIADRINENSKLPNIKKGNYVFLEKGDLILADASEDYQGIATPAIVTIDTPYKLVSGLHTIALRPKNVDSLFLYYLIHSPIFRKYGYRTGTGMKVFGISVSNLLKFESYFPLVENQIKISRFLKNFDEIINFHQLKIGQFQLLKKVLLQKMFV
nr:restriction endonuclease subunit S [Rummeliibacillus sp. SL167]